MSKKAVKRNKPAAKVSTVQSSRCVVIFGLDEEGKSRGARFETEDEHVLTRLAQARGLRIGVAQGPKHADLVSKLPSGRVFATGSSSVPLIPKGVYELLNAAVGGDPGQIVSSLPKSWGEIAPGHVVLAQASVDSGYWEAVVVSREGDTLRLRYRDYPGEPETLRHVDAVALLNSDPSGPVAAAASSEQERSHDA